MPRMNPLMAADSLTGESRSYLLGLYLADGDLNGNKIRSNTVRYSLQWNERDIAGRIAILLRSMHLKPLIYHKKSRGSIVVCATSTNLQQFFPDKGLLLADEDLRRRFFEKNDLFNRDNRVAFVAGLMDGDGTCRAYLKRGEIKSKGAFGKIQAKWLFSQTRFPFLLDFFEEFVRQIAPNSLTRIRRDGKVEGASINRGGREALLRVGIARWSSKVRKWMDEVSRLLKKREEKKAEWIDKIGHLGVKLRDAAKMVGVSRERLSQLHRSGSLLALRLFEGKRAILVVPPNEVERLRQRYLKTEKRAERIRGDGMTLSDLSNVIGVSPSTLHRWYQRGHLKAILARNRDHRCLVVPKKEVDRIRAEHLMSSNQQTVARTQ